MLMEPYGFIRVFGIIQVVQYGLAVQNSQTWGDSRSFGMCKVDTSVRCRMNVNHVAEVPWIRGVLSNVLAEFGPPQKTHIHGSVDAFGGVARPQMVHLRARHT